MSNFMGVGIFWIGLNRGYLGCWRLTLNLRNIIQVELYYRTYTFFSDKKLEN